MPNDEKVIPATERELEIIDRYCWFMWRISAFAVEIQVMPKDLVIKKEGIKIFNSYTKCWEDWSENGESE